jgi:hypothetical protein
MNAVERLKRNRQRVWRARRMLAFVTSVRPRPGCRIIDLGGTPELWEHLDMPLEVTLLNECEDDLHAGPAARGDRRSFRRVVGDACAASMFADGEFDIAFSNSVIEHVGSPAREAAFAREVRRLASAYWVQTPSPWFPIEAHCGLPGWWLYPRPVRDAWIRRWRAKGRDFTAEQMAATRAVTRQRLASLFPDCRFFSERVCGLPKSLSAYAPLPAG